MLMRKSTRRTSKLPLVLALGGFMLLAGCFDESEQSKTAPSGGTGGASAPAPTPTPAPNPSTSNLPPSISGAAPTRATVGEDYSFKPAATDPDGDPISFSASGVPKWLTFDPASGSLAGRPSAADVATYTGIRISVTDGKATASLRIAQLDVVQASAGGSPGSATLEWEAPTVNADGTPLTDLAGYNIRFGTSPGVLDRLVEVRNPGITTFVVDDLAPATWYFAISSVNSEGIESQTTSLVWTTIG
jgi:hypothetical protein